VPKDKAFHTKGGGGVKMLLSVSGNISVNEEPLKPLVFSQPSQLLPAKVD